MLIKNVQFAHEPEKVIVQRIGNTYKAKIDMPVNIREEEREEEEGKNTFYTADVYTIEVDYTENLKERILNNYDKWILRAAAATPITPTIQDAFEAINALTEIILGGE